MAFTSEDPDREGGFYQQRVAEQTRGHAYGSDLFDEAPPIKRPYLAPLPARTPIDVAHEAILAAYDALRVPQYSEAARSRYWEAVGEAKGLLRAANIIGALRATSEKASDHA